MIYLLHFARPLHRAQHYLGTCEDNRFKERLERHLAGRGSRLMKAVAEAGIEVRLVRVWTGGRNEERRLKNQKNGRRLCLLCQQRRRQ